MAMATKAPAKAADKPQATRATYKGHGHPAEFAFFGTGTKPETGKAVASCETSAHGFDLRDKAGKLICSIGVATKYWAGPLSDGTWGEVAGTQALPEKPSIPEPTLAEAAKRHEAVEAGKAKPLPEVTNEALGKQGDQGAVPNYCRCGCGASVSRFFKPGHDARFSGQLRRAYEAGEITRDEALLQVAFSPLLVSKLGRALDLAAQRIAARSKSTETAKASKS